MEEKAEQAKQQKQNDNLLLLACTRGYCADAQHLVQTGANIAAQDKKKVRALHFAAAHGHLDVVSFLWSKGAELDWETPDGRSSLHLAALKGHSRVVQFLLSKQAWADAQDAQDNTAMHLAARGKSTQTVIELLKVSASTNIANKLGLTPLAEAILSARTEIAQLLINKDAKALQGRSNGWSLLHLAAGTGQPASVEMLLRQGANVHDKERASGLTPLHAAAMSGNVACINLLLDAGALTALRSHEGSVPADLIPQDHPDQSQLLVLLKASAASSDSAHSNTSKPTTPAPSEAVGSSAPPQVQKFRALDQAAQLKRVERWGEGGPEDPQVSGELTHFWPEVKRRTALAHKTVQVLALHKVLMMLHDDEDYQKDVGNPDTMDAILSDVKQHPEKLQQYSTDPAKQNVFKKMELFTLVCKATEQRGQVPWQETLVPPDNPAWKEQDQTRKKGLEMMLRSQQQAIIAAALAGSDQEATKKADAAEGASRKHSQQSQQATATTTSTGPSKPEATTSSSNNRGNNVTSAAVPSQAAQTGLKSRKTQQKDVQAATASSPVSNSLDSDEPQVMTWKEALWHLRWQIGGYAVLLLAFWVWLLWTDYQAVQRKNAAESNASDFASDAGPVHGRNAETL